MTASDPQGHRQDDWLTAIGRAQEALAAAERRLAESVRRARDEGRTWQQIADVLGVTRQAAFKRFGHPTDPQTGEPLHPHPALDVAGLTAEAFRLFLDGELEQVRSRMTQVCARELSKRRIAAVHDEVLAAYGERAEVAAVSVHIPTGERLSDGAVELVGGRPSAVGRVLLRFEAAELVGHAVINRAGRIAGMTVRPVELETWPL
ncbi:MULTISPECIES: hypothetical protein [unclassified Luteococcus]|uniref:hypothetical protein n=1 Tax=unclassified Luteococcus TaxID=2639923 RepID=UPI00313EE871